MCCHDLWWDSMRTYCLGQNWSNRPQVDSLQWAWILCGLRSAGTVWRRTFCGRKGHGSSLKCDAVARKVQNASAAIIIAFLAQLMLGISRDKNTMKGLDSRNGPQPTNPQRKSSPRCNRVQTAAQTCSELTYSAVLWDEVHFPSLRTSWLEHIRWSTIRTQHTNTLETRYKALPYNVVLAVTYDIFGPLLCLLH